LAFGAPASLKSLWAMWLGAKLAHEGHKVAYFSLEMRPSDTTKRLRRLAPPVDKFKWYSKFSFSSPAHVESACELLRGFSLIVIDSWSAAATQLEMRDSNQAVARLDQDVFMPLMEETGAALLILDNVGHPDLQSGRKPDWARGASAKMDKVDIALWFERPDTSDNYTTRIKVQKMRLDRGTPKPIIIRTGKGDIEFEVLGENDTVLGPLWGYFGNVDPYEAETERPKGLLDRLRDARDSDRLGEVINLRSSDE
jgi:hypothetical protein